MRLLNSYACAGRCGGRVLIAGALCGVCQPMPAPRAQKAATLLATPVTVRARVPALRPLTARQYEILGYVREYVADHGYAPTLEEIAIALPTAAGVHSMAQVWEDLQALQRYRYLALDRHSARGITLLETREDGAA